MSTTCHFYPIWSRLDKVWFLETGGSESPMPELERSLGTHWISEVNLCLNAAKEFAPHNGAKWTLTENQRWGVLTPDLEKVKWSMNKFIISVGHCFAICIKGGEYIIIHLVIICVLCWCILLTPIYLLEEAYWPEIYVTMLSGTYLASSEGLHLCLSHNFIGVYISCQWILLCGNDAMKVKVILRAIIITGIYLGYNISVQA